MRDMYDSTYIIQKKSTFLEKVWLFIAFASLFGTNLYLTRVYRPYIYENGIYDYHFADFHPSLFAIPTTYYFLLYIFSLKNRTCDVQKCTSLILPIVLVHILYEFLHVFIRVFDYYDLGAIIVGGAITYLGVILGYFFKKFALKMFPSIGKK